MHNVLCGHRRNTQFCRWREEPSLKIGTETWYESSVRWQFFQISSINKSMETSRSKWCLGNEKQPMVASVGYEGEWQEWRLAWQVCPRRDSTASLRTLALILQATENCLRILIKGVDQACSFKSILEWRRMEEWRPGRQVLEYAREQQRKSVLNNKRKVRGRRRWRHFR